tara:strand:+ start:385 stop:1716 length:1332 start_codon:yes stop_codon:yes gene_type:complete
MSTIKINQLATSDVELTDFVIKADSAGVATKNTVQGIADAVNTTIGIKSVNVGVNAEIDSTAIGSSLIGGTDSYPNKLGVNNTMPIDQPDLGGRTIDTNYVAGTAEVASILAGYDNVNNALAGIIASQHSMLYTGADHGTIIGGSLHSCEGETDYSGIFSGTNNLIEKNCKYALILGGEKNTLKEGVDYNNSGFRSLILTSELSEIKGRNGVVIGGDNNVINSKYGTILNGKTVNLLDGDHILASGNYITAGANSPASYSVIFGTDVNVDSARVFVLGEGHVIESEKIYSQTTGYRCKPPMTGSIVNSSRQRGGTVGNNMTLSWSASQETTGTSLTSLSLYGSTSYPKQPENSIVNGTILVTGVDALGECSTYSIEVVSQRIGSANPTIKRGVVTTLYDGLSLPTAPAMNGTSSGIYRVRVTGLSATDISWQASFNGHQIVFA